MTEVFTPPIPPTTRPTGAVKFRILKASFGDGYEQRAGDGLNTRAQSWSLTFNGTEAEVQPIQDFLDARAGVESFYWTPPGPGASQKLFACDGYSVVPHVGAQVVLSCVFNEVFFP